MSQRKWYRKKRYWLLIILTVFFFVTRMEFLKLRYQPDQLSLKIAKETGLPVAFDHRKLAQKTIHFFKVGDRSHLPLIIFVHGSPGALNAYELYFSDSLLAEKADMIALDRPGFGYSDFGKSESSLEVQAALIAQILKDFPDRKKILVGHSMGGPVISKTAMDFPEYVDGLVMVAPSISPVLEPSNRLRKVLDFPLIRWFTPPALRVCNQEIIPLKEELDLMMNDWKDIMVPVTVVQGMADNLVPMGNANFAKSIMDQNPNVKTKMIEGGNHFILWSEVPIVREEILRVLAMSY